MFPNRRLHKSSKLHEFSYSCLKTVLCSSAFLKLKIELLNLKTLVQSIQLLLTDGLSTVGCLGKHVGGREGGDTINFRRKVNSRADALQLSSTWAMRCLLACSPLKLKDSSSFFVSNQKGQSTILYRLDSCCQNC